MAKKIYKSGNYLYIEDTATGLITNGSASTFEFVKYSGASTQYYVKKDGEHIFPRRIDLSEMVDENDVPYTESTFKTFKEANTGFNPPQVGGATQESLDAVESDLQTQINTLGTSSPSDAFYVRRDEVLDEGANLYNKNDPDNNNSGWLNASNVPQSHVSATHTKYFPLVESQDYWYLNAYGASTSLIITDSNFAVVRAITGTVDNTFTAAAGEAYVRFSVRDMDTFMFAKGSVIGTYEAYLFRIKPDVVDDNPFKDKGVVLFGDSITWLSTGWPVYFESIVKPLYVDNYAVSGQRITWNGNTIEAPSPANDSGDNNVLWNSIKGWEINNTNGDPDAIIIAIGTNDISQGSILGSFNDAFAQSEATTTQLTMANAFRKAIFYLKDNYPNTKIFYSTPVQSKTGGRTYTTISNVANILTEICKRQNVKVIDSTNNCGITDEFENASAVGRYLYDGTHPSHSGNTATTLVGAEYGAKLLGEYIGYEFIRLYD